MHKFTVASRRMSVDAGAAHAQTEASIDSGYDTLIVFFNGLQTCKQSSHRQDSRGQITDKSTGKLLIRNPQVSLIMPTQCTDELCRMDNVFGCMTRA
jgi:hypothetical protein